MIDLRVAVIPRKEVRSYGRGGGLMDALPLGQALERHWESPALFCCYYVEDEPRWPRLRKQDLRTIEGRGGGVFVHSLVFDYDLHDEAGKKRCWSSADESAALLAKLADAGLLPTVFYTTKHGARLIYLLATAVQPHDAEQCYREMLRRLADIGISSDEKTADWTRFFTLPFVTKEDGEVLWESTAIYVEYFPEQRLHANVLLHGIEGFHPLKLEGDKPSAEEVERQLYTIGKSASDGLVRKRTPAHRKARQLLKNSPWFPQVEGAAAGFQTGERDTKINTMVWSVVRTLWGRIEEAGPPLIYALLQASVSSIEADAGEPEWTDVLWEKTLRIWEQQHDQEQLERISQQQIEARVLGGFKDLVHKSKAHLPQLMQRAGIDNELEFCRRHLIAVLGNELYPIDETGRYLGRPASRGGLHGTVHTMGLADLYGLWDADGKARSVDEILREHGVSVSRAEGRLGIQRAELRGFGDDLHLLVPTYHLVDIHAEYVAEVDDWLHAFAGHYYERLADWLGHAQDIYRPICALSLCGEGGTGKSFLAELVAKRFGPGQKSTEQSLGDWNSGLAGNPVIHIDEGMGSSKYGKAVDEVFRTYVAGGYLEVREKFRVSRVCELYPRVIIAANDLDTLQRTISGRDLNDASHAALAERVLHLQVDASAKAKLHRDSTHNWITGDQLGLKHLAWLYENRDNPSKWSGRGRFLVEGDRHAEVLDEARFTTPLMMAVMTTIVSCVEATGNVAGGFTVTGKEVSVNAHSVLEVMNRRASNTLDMRNVNHRNIGAALKKLGECTRTASERRWGIPVGRLLTHALRYGLPCARLQQAFLGEFGEAALTALQREVA